MNWKILKQIILNMNNGGNMLEKLDNYIKVSEYLGDILNEKKIHSLKNNIKTNSFNLLFVGQFSSGKSNLINNIIGKKILPVKTTETTSYLTNIQYGDRDKVVLTRVSGNKEEITFDTLMKLNQYSIDNESNGNQIWENIDSIEEINIFLNLPLLESGLRIIDTPGINTINSNHENFTYSVIPKAHYFFYIMGKSLTESDLSFIKSIQNIGVKIVFIRTKVDLLNETEGDFLEIVVKKDKMLIDEKLAGEYKYLPVSNNIETPALKELFDNMMRFISSDITSDISNNLENAVSQRLNTIKQDFLVGLNNKKATLEKSRSCSIEKIESDIEKIERKLTSQNNNLKSMQNEIAIEMTELKNNICNGIKLEKERCFDSFINALDSIINYDNIYLEATKIGNTIVQQFTNNTKIILRESIKEAKKKYDKLRENAIDICHDIETDYEIKNIEFGEINFNFEEYLNENTSSYMNHLLDSYNTAKLMMQQSKEDLNIIDINKNDLETEILKFESAANEAKINFDNLGGYIPQYKIEEGNKIASGIMGKIGTVADLALFFLPGSAITAAAGKVAKGAKAAKFIKDSAKAVEVIDKVRDGMLFTQKFVQGTQKFRENQVGAEKQSGILDIIDLISVEFWMKKLGETIDTPDKQIIDKEWEIEYKKQRHILEQEYALRRQKEISQREQAGLLKTKEEKVKKEQQMLEIDLRLIEEKMIQEKENIRNKITKTKLNFAKDNIAEEFKKELINLSSQILEKSSYSISTLAGKIIMTAEIDNNNDLSILKSFLEETRSKRNNTEEESKLQINEIISLIKLL